jgi:hypothetical protein
MNKAWLFLIIFMLFFQDMQLKAQFVRRDEYTSERDRRNQYELDDWVSYMQGKRINNIAAGHNYLYFATTDGGIWRYELYQNYWDYPFTTSNGLSSNNILEVAYDFGNSLLWAVTEVDTCIFKPAEQRWVCQSEESLWPNEYPESKFPNSGNSIEQNVFYPGNYLNLLPQFFANGPWTIIENWKLMDQNFDEFQINGFLRDRWERIWFVIEGLGVGMGNLFSERLDVIPLGLSDISPRVVQYQDDDLWIGGQSFSGELRPGISNWRNQDGGWYIYQARWISNLPSNNIRDIAVTGDSVWFASDYGLSLYIRSRDKWQNFDVRQGLYSTEILNILVHKEYLYIATDRGLNRLHLKTGLIKRLKDDNIHLATVSQISAEVDTLWAATNRGLYRRRTESAGWEVVRVPTAISDIPVLFAENYKNEMWFASPGGIFWFDSITKKWESFPQLGLELTGSYFDIEVDANSVWVSTAEGLLKYNRNMKYWKLFTVNDGLLSNQCFRLLLDGDYIWISNRLGITSFYWNSPSRID